MTNSPTKPVAPLSDEALAEIEKRPAKPGNTVWYHVPLTPTERDALCQTVRAAWKELSEAYYEDCEICDQEIVSGDGTKIYTFAVCGRCWNNSQETNAALREQLAQETKELTIARRFLVRQGFYRCTGPACGCGGNDWHERL